MKLLAITISSLFLHSAVLSQLYSLEDCFAAAEKNNISFQKNKNIIQSSYIDKKAAKFNLLPAVYANAEHFLSSGKSINPVTNNFVKDDFSGGNFDVAMELNIFSGFNALNAIKGSLYKIKASEYAYRKNKLEIFSAIIIAYAKATYSKEQVATIKNNNQHTQKELEIVQEKINVGKLSKSDYYTINTRNKSEQADIVETQNNSLTAVNELKYLIGLDYKAYFLIKDIDSAAIKSIERKAFTLSDILDKVLKDHPALLESIFTERYAAMNLKTAKGNLLPNVSLAGNIFSNYNLGDRNLNNNHISLGEQINNNFGKTAGIVLEIPLFNKYQNRFTIERERINLANAKLDTRQIENDIIKNTQQLLNDFISAKQKYLLQAESLQQAELSYNAFEERYKLGYISPIELIFAKEQLYAQQLKTMQAKYSLYFSYKLIELLMLTEEV